MVSLIAGLKPEQWAPRDTKQKAKSRLQDRQTQRGRQDGESQDTGQMPNPLPPKKVDPSSGNHLLAPLQMK